MCSIQCYGMPVLLFLCMSTLLFRSINEQYGLGYKWAPSELTVEVGDTVEWSWIGVPFAQWFSVAQVTTCILVLYTLTEG